MSGKLLSAYKVEVIYEFQLFLFCSGEKPDLGKFKTFYGLLWINDSFFLKHCSLLTPKG